MHLPKTYSLLFSLVAFSLYQGAAAEEQEVLQPGQAIDENLIYDAGFTQSDFGFFDDDDEYIEYYGDSDTMYTTVRMNNVRVDVVIHNETASTCDDAGRTINLWFQKARVADRVRNLRYETNGYEKARKEIIRPIYQEIADGIKSVCSSQIEYISKNTEVSSRSYFRENTVSDLYEYLYPRRSTPDLKLENESGRIVCRVRPESGSSPPPSQLRSISDIKTHLDHIPIVNATDIQLLDSDRYAYRSGVMLDVRVKGKSQLRSFRAFKGIDRGEDVLRELEVFESLKSNPKMHLPQLHGIVVSPSGSLLGLMLEMIDGARKLDARLIAGVWEGRRGLQRHLEDSIDDIAQQAGITHEEAKRSQALIDEEGVVWMYNFFAADKKKAPKFSRRHDHTDEYPGWDDMGWMSSVIRALQADEQLGEDAANEIHPRYGGAAFMMVEEKGC